MATPHRAATSGYYLGFDCATKTFAFCLLRIDLAGFAPRLDELRRRAAGLKAALAKPRPDLRALAAEAGRLDAETRSYLEVIDGEMVDLAPGKPDESVHTVERVKALHAYLRRRVFPALAKLPAGHPLEVAIEFQEGANAKARIISAALAMAIVTQYDGRALIYFVGPTHKNKLAFGEAGRYCYFTERYSTNYGANKAHAKHNFARLEALFPSGAPASKAAARGHVADACLTVLGHLAFGDTADPESHY